MTRQPNVARRRSRPSLSEVSLARARWQTPEPDDARARSMRPLVRAQTLGAAALLVGAQRLDPSAGTIFALLLRVLYGAGCTVAREILLRTLWHGQAETRQRANLRQALYKLRQMGVQIGLEGDVVTLDALQIAPVFATHRTGPRFEQDVTLGHEPFGLFLPGFRTGWAEYDEWLDVVRESVHADVRRVLVEQLRNRRARADWMGADAIARWLLQFDPLNEEATLTTAECSALNGSKAEAVAMLDRYLAELGPDAGDLRLQATLLRRRISEPHGKQRVSFAPTERHFIGREELMAELTLAMRRAKWHDGSATLLHGPPGMGKTRVTQELAKVAVLEGFRVVSVSCRESDQQRPLSVFLELVPELLEMPGAMGCSPESMAVLRRLVDEDEHADVQSSTVSRTPSNSRVCTDPSSFPLPSRIRQAISDLVSGLCFENPILLVFDDVQKMDDESHYILRELCRGASNARLFVLLTSREGRSSRQAGWIAPETRSIPLAPLSAESCASLADAIGFDVNASFDEALRAWFVNASEGTPLYLRALVGHWIETGVAGGVPPTLANLIEQRLMSLSSDALRTTQVASLLGRHANAMNICAILELSTTRMLSAFDELVEIGACTESAGVLRFHELFAQGAVSKLAASSTQLVHGRIAALLQEDRFVGDESIVADTVVHLRKSGVPEMLGRYALQSSLELLKRGMPHRALAVCEAAIAHVSPTSIRDSIQRVQLQSLHLAGHHSKLFVKLPVTLGPSDYDPEWDEGHAEELITVLDSTRHSTDFEDFAEAAARATLLAESRTISAELRARAATVALRLSGNVELNDVPTRAFEAGLRAAAACEQTELVKNELRMFFHSSFGAFAEGAEAARWICDNISLYESRTVQTTMLSYIAYALRVNGEPVAAKQLYLNTLERAGAAEMHSAAAYVAWNLSLIEFDWTGDLAAAAHWISIALSHCRSDDQDRCRAVVQQNQVRLAIVRGELEEAQCRLSELRAQSWSSGIPVRTAYPLAMALGTAVLSGSVDQTEELLSEAIRIHRLTRAMNGQDFLTHQIWRALRMLGRAEDAQEVLLDYLANHRRGGPQIPNYLASAVHSSH